MKRTFTLYFLFIISYSFAQVDPPGRVCTRCVNEPSPSTEIVTYCPGLSKQVDTARRGFVCKTGGIDIVKKDSIVNKGYKGSVCGASRSITGNSQPLIIVDGDIVKTGHLTVLDPNDVDSIWVLKSAAAMALYGPEGYNGAILISTKKPTTFIVKDFTDGSRVAGATVVFTSLKDKNEKLQFIADDSGIVRTKKLNRFNRYEMAVSAVGHITTKQGFENNSRKEKEIFLNRDAKACDEIVVKGYPTRTIACDDGAAAFRSACVGVSFIAGVSKKEQSLNKVLGFQIYPNPVQQGASLNLQFDNTGEKEKLVRVLSLDGKTLLQQVYPAAEGKNMARLPVDIRWPAGVYFIQLLYENGRVLASEKIIIQ